VKNKELKECWKRFDSLTDEDIRKLLKEEGILCKQD